jgi:hypothetical protein
MRAIFSQEARMKWAALVIVAALASCGGLNSKQREVALNSKQREVASAALNTLEKIHASTQVGVSLNNYILLLLEAKAKVHEASRELPDGKLKTELNAAIDGYSDAAQVWNFKIQHNGLFYEKSGPTPITDKYKLQDVIAKTPYGMLEGDKVTQIIWAATKPHLDKAETLMK